MYVAKQVQGASPAEKQQEYVGVLKHALENTSGALKPALRLLDEIATGKAPNVDLVFLANAGTEARLVADMVARLVTRHGLKDEAVGDDVTLVRASWPSLARAAAGERGVAVFRNADRLNATVATAWLREQLRDAQGKATVFFELAGPDSASFGLISAVRVLARQHGARVQVLDFRATDD